MLVMEQTLWQLHPVLVGTQRVQATLCWETQPIANAASALSHGTGASHAGSTYLLTPSFLTNLLVACQTILSEADANAVQVNKGKSRRTAVKEDTSSDEAGSQVGKQDQQDKQRQPSGKSSNSKLAADTASNSLEVHKELHATYSALPARVCHCCISSWSCVMCMSVACADDKHVVRVGTDVSLVDKTGRQQPPQEQQRGGEPAPANPRKRRGHPSEEEERQASKKARTVPGETAKRKVGRPRKALQASDTAALTQVRHVMPTAHQLCATSAQVTRQIRHFCNFRNNPPILGLICCE